MGRLRETSATDKRLVTMQGDLSADIGELRVERAQPRRERLAR
jgi:hypothetical protein